MTTSRIFAGVLVLMAALVLLGLCGSVLSGNDAAIDDLQPGWADALNRLLVRKQRLEAADLRPDVAACIQTGQLVIESNQTCRYQVAGGGDVRELALRLAEGNAVQVTLQQGALRAERALTVTEQESAFDITEDGVMLVLRCTAVQRGRCRVTVQ